MSEANTVTSVEQDGRTLSGVGASAEALETVMERHAPPDPTPDAPAAPAAAVASETPAAPVSRGRQRYSDLTKARDDEKARADAAERRASELEARLSAPPAAASPGADTRPAPAAPAAAASAFDFPDYDAYLQTHPETSYDAWRRAEIAAFSDWKDAQTDLPARIREVLDGDRARAEFGQTVRSIYAKGRDAYADFDTVLASGPGAGILLGPTEDEGRSRVDYIVRHPRSEHLQYAILKDATLAKRLASLDAIHFGLELEKIAPSGSGASPASPARAGSVTPPAPYQPVGSGSSTTVSPSAELAKRGFDFDKSGYRERRAAERGARRR